VCYRDSCPHLSRWWSSPGYNYSYSYVNPTAYQHVDPETKNSNAGEHDPDSGGYNSDGGEHNPGRYPDRHSDRSTRDINQWPDFGRAKGRGSAEFRHAES
jgi:hypothetical protein